MEVPATDIDRIGKVAREHRLHVVGVIERDGGTLYCTALFFADDGAFLGKHRKLMPTAAERLVWGFGDGSTLPVFDTLLGRLGAVICRENYMPMLRMAMYSKGVQLYCVPTADDRQTWLPTMRHVALEGRCFVLTACQALRRSDTPLDIPNALGVDVTGHYVRPDVFQLTRDERPQRPVVQRTVRTLRLKCVRRSVRRLAGRDEASGIGH